MSAVENGIANPALPLLTCCEAPGRLLNLSGPSVKSGNCSPVEPAPLSLSHLIGYLKEESENPQPRTHIFLPALVFPVALTGPSSARPSAVLLRCVECCPVPISPCPFTSILLLLQLWLCSLSTSAALPALSLLGENSVLRQGLTL